MSNGGSSEGQPAVRRAWEAPALTVLSFRHTAGNQQPGQDDPQNASFGGPGFTERVGKLGVGVDGPFATLILPPIS